MFQLAGAIGVQELLIIGGLFLLLFGAKKLPELARSMGASISSFKKGLKEELPELGDSTKKGPKEDARELGDSTGKPNRSAEPAQKVRDRDAS